MVLYFGEVLTALARELFQMFRSIRKSMRRSMAYQKGILQKFGCPFIGIDSFNKKYPLGSILLLRYLNYLELGIIPPRSSSFGDLSKMAPKDIIGLRNRWNFLKIVSKRNFLIYRERC